MCCHRQKVDFCEVLSTHSSHLLQQPLEILNSWKAQLHVLLNGASYAFENVIQQDHKCQIFPVCVWFVYSDFTSSFLLSSHDVKGLVVPPSLPIPNVQKSCRESKLDLHPQDVGQENCSLAGGSLWLLSIPFTLFDRHKVNLADLSIGVRSTLRAEHILSLVLVHANELLAPFSQVDDVCTFSRASLKYKGRAKEFQCTWWLVPSAI